MKTRLVSLTLAASAGLLLAGLWTRASVAPLSREALRSSFDSGIRNLVIEWDPADTRPEAERRKAGPRICRDAEYDGAVPSFDQNVGQGFWQTLAARDRQQMRLALAARGLDQRCVIEPL